MIIKLNKLPQIGTKNSGVKLNCDLIHYVLCPFSYEKDLKHMLRQ